MPIVDSDVLDLDEKIPLLPGKELPDQPKSYGSIVSIVKFPEPTLPEPVVKPSQKELLKLCSLGGGSRFFPGALEFLEQPENGAPTRTLPTPGARVTL